MSSPVRFYDVPLSNNLWQELDHEALKATFFFYNAHFDLRARPMVRVFFITKGTATNEWPRVLKAAVVLASCWL